MFDLDEKRMLINPQTMKGCATKHFTMVTCYKWIEWGRNGYWQSVGSAKDEETAWRWLDGEDVEMLT